MSSFREQLRHTTYDEIHISPHMDDTAYSCAGRVLGRRREGAKVLVVTVFGNGKNALDPGDKGTFSDYATRLAEEERVMQRLDVDYVWLNYPELLFRKKSAGDLVRFLLPFLPLSGEAHDDLFEAILGVLHARLAQGGQVFFPFAVGFHPDHRVLFDVGRAVHALSRFDVRFYEDVPYACVPALRALRLRFLGMPAQLPLVRATRDTNVFLFRNFGHWRRITWLPVLFYLLSLRLAHTLLRRLDRLPGEPDPSLEVRDIAAELEEKAEIMRLYPSQTAFFLTLGPELPQMIKFEGKAQELSWRFPAFTSAAQRLSAAQKRVVERMMSPSASPEPGAPSPEASLS